MTQRLKLWLTLALIVVFFAGGALGFWAAIFHIRIRHGGPVAHRMHEHLRRELQLSPEQDAKITPILEQMDQRLEAIRTETGQHVREAMNQSHEQIVPLLNPEQQKKLQEMRERHRRIMHIHGGDMPPPPDGH